MWYGFYSRKQEHTFARIKGLDDRQQKVAIYRHANGSEVRCTEISSNPDYRSGFDDCQSLGEVVKFLRQESPIALPTAPSREEQSR